MKKFILPAIILAVILTSCKKNVTTVNKAGIWATLDGVELSFNAQITIDTNHVGLIVIKGYTSNSKDSGISFSINGARSLDKGVYPYTATDGRSSRIGYIEQNPVYREFFSSDNTVTITDLSSTSIAATFQGTMIFYSIDISGRWTPIDTEVMKNGHINLLIGNE